jgi:hypothetical protein
MLPMQVTTYLRIMDGDQTPQGALRPAVDICHVDAGHPWISVSTPREPSSLSSMFVVLMVGALRSLLAPPPRGAHHRCFLALMVGTLGSSSLPPRGPAIDVSSIDGERSRIFSTTPYEAYGPIIDVSSVDGGRS